MTLTCGNCGNFRTNYCWVLMAFQRADFHSCGSNFLSIDTLAGKLAAAGVARGIATLRVNQAVMP